MASVPNVISESFVAINHSCSQSQGRNFVKEVVGTVVCCHGKKGHALETSCKVEQILVLLFSGFPTRSKRLQLLLTLVESSTDVRFDLSNQLPAFTHLESKSYIWEFLLHHLRQYVAELPLKRLNADAVFLESGPRFFALEEVFLGGMPIERGIFQFGLAGILDHRPAKLEFVAPAYWKLVQWEACLQKSLVGTYLPLD